MDVTALRNGIQATLDPNTDTRRQAELALKHVRPDDQKQETWPEEALFWASPFSSSTVFPYSHSPAF